LTFITVTILLESAPSALAASRGDMFSDQGYIMTDRPWIAGDPPRSDLFSRNNYPAISPHKDMFDHANPPRTYYGANDMFNPNPKPAPHDPLFEWPQRPMRGH
jgi:hypothetical protein